MQLDDIQALLVKLEQRMTSLEIDSRQSVLTENKDLTKYFSAKDTPFPPLQP